MGARIMKRILIVEDEPSIALALEEDLRREGYQTDVARDGESGAQKALAGGFDLVLLDVMLPKKDGFDVCRQVRRAGLGVPIILLTARGQEAEKVMGLELGADDYVTKPYSARELRARVKAQLRRADSSAAGTSGVYRFGDAELDLVRCELRRASRNEFEVELFVLAHFALDGEVFLVARSTGGAHAAAARGITE